MHLAPCFLALAHLYDDDHGADDADGTLFFLHLHPHIYICWWISDADADGAEGGADDADGTLSVTLSTNISDTEMNVQRVGSTLCSGYVVDIICERSKYQEYQESRWNPCQNFDSFWAVPVEQKRRD